MSSYMNPWSGEKWLVSRYNYSFHPWKDERKMRRVEFYDVTLRDGEQTPGVVFRKEEKLEIARALDEVGVHRIEAGMPVVSDEDFAAVKAIAHEGLEAKIFGFSRLLKEDIDVVLKCDVAGLVCEGPVGEPKLRQLGWTEAEVVEKAIEAVTYAKSHGLYTVFFGVDTTRANPRFLTRLIRRLTIEAKPDAIALVDTFGCITPMAMAELVRSVKKRFRTPIEIHCHNDLGLATACTIAAVEAGAEVVHTSVNGIGERCGNASFEEVALALRLLYGVKTDLKFESFYRLSRLVEKHSRVPVPSNKPVVGERAFTREAGIAVAGWMKYYLGSEPYLPELVGNSHGVVLGKKSGRHSIEWKLRELGLKATQQQVGKILELVKSRSEAKKGPVSDEEFIELTRNVL